MTASTTTNASSRATDSASKRPNNLGRICLTWVSRAGNINTTASQPPRDCDNSDAATPATTATAMNARHHQARQRQNIAAQTMAMQPSSKARLPH